MSLPAESQPPESRLRDAQPYTRLLTLNVALDSALHGNDYLAELLPVQDDYGIHFETIIGGLVPAQQEEVNTYIDITLVRSRALGEWITHLVAADTQYDITKEAVVVARSAGDMPSLPDIDLLSYWLERDPLVAIWSREDTLRLAGKWREAQRTRRLKNNNADK